VKIGNSVNIGTIHQRRPVEKGWGGCEPRGRPWTGVGRPSTNNFFKSVDGEVFAKRTMLDRGGGVSKKSGFARTSLMNDH